MNWIGALKLVPWGEVAKNAPALVNGARKLMNRAGKNASLNGEAGSAGQEGRSAQDDGGSTALQARLSTLETSLAELQSEMSASALLIKDLAEQNAQLVGALDSLRKRLAIALGVTALLALVLVGVIVAVAR